MAGAEKRRGRSGFYVPKCLAKWYTSKLYGESQPLFLKTMIYRIARVSIEKYNDLLVSGYNDLLAEATNECLIAWKKRIWIIVLSTHERSYRMSWPL